jgi:hypothetical protein
MYEGIRELAKWYTDFQVLEKEVHKPCPLCRIRLGMRDRTGSSNINNVAIIPAESHVDIEQRDEMI